MEGYQLWQAYVQVLLGVQVEDAAEKFSALSDGEQAAWAAVAALEAPVEVQSEVK